MATVEDGIRQRIEANEAQIKDLRMRALPMMTWEKGALIVDSRYKSEIADIRAEEKKASADTERKGAALNRAVELTKGIKGVDRSHPFTWLKKRISELQDDFDKCQTEITGKMRRLESRGVLARVSEITSHNDMNDQVKQYQARAKEIKPELEQIKRLHQEVEKIFYEARI
jgi:hypothetical protein